MATLGGLRFTAAPAGQGYGEYLHMRLYHPKSCRTVVENQFQGLLRRAQGMELNAAPVKPCERGPPPPAFMHWPESPLLHASVCRQRDYP